MYTTERYEQRMLHPEELELIQAREPIYRSRRVQPALTREINIARDFLRAFEKYPWFHLDDISKFRLQALISFERKVIVRLQKREDLPAVMRILENFSKFVYAFLPEHQTNLEDDYLQELQNEGTSCLDKFVEDVNKLIETPTKHQEKEKDSHTSRPNRTKRLQAFYFSNVFFRFTIWLLFLIVVTSGLVFLTSLRIPQLDINIMVSMVIATSVTGAAALAVLGGRNVKPGHGEESGEISIDHDTYNVD